MNRFTIEEIKEQNSKSAKAIGFLFAAIAVSLVWGFLQDSLPAFLLAGVFSLIMFAETREYKKSYQIEMEAAKLEDDQVS
ncbi:uncharacterized membrane protein YjjP (DUF1212 family) [Planomicrobium sp. HSC-17F08]|nr:uncharacterized membrane protein YjjP (DUF1212 family) [Planomicrobium sp. HSC-17F08]